MAANFPEPVHISVDQEDQTVRLAVASSDTCVDEHTFDVADFRGIEKAVVNRSEEWEGPALLKVRFQQGVFSVSIQLGYRHRTVYRIPEMPFVRAMAVFKAECGPA